MVIRIFYQFEKNHKKPYLTSVWDKIIFNRKAKKNIYQFDFQIFKINKSKVRRF